MLRSPTRALIVAPESTGQAAIRQLERIAALGSDGIGDMHKGRDGSVRSEVFHRVWTSLWVPMGPEQR